MLHNLTSGLVSVIVGVTRHHNIVLKYLGITEPQSSKQHCCTSSKPGEKKKKIGKIKTVSSSIQRDLTQMLMMGELREIRDRGSGLKK